jgi:hypothetical protein
MQDLSHPVQRELIQPLIQLFQDALENTSSSHTFSGVSNFKYYKSENGVNSEYSYIVMVVDTEVLPNTIVRFEFPKPDHLTNWELVFQLVKVKLNEFGISDPKLYNSVISRIYETLILEINPKFEISNLPFSEVQLDTYLKLLQNIKTPPVHSGKIHLIKIIDVLGSDDKRNHLAFIKPLIELRLNLSFKDNNSNRPRMFPSLNMFHSFKMSCFPSFKDGSALLIVGGRLDYISIDTLPQSLTEEETISLMHEIYVLCAKNNFTLEEINSLMNHVLKRSVLDTHE